MKKILTILSLLSIAAATPAMAGNIDRTGTNAASELLINPWARSSGWGGINTANITGVESLNLNVGGLAMTHGTEFVGSSTNWLGGSGVNISALGFSQQLGDSGKGGVLGLDIMSVAFGSIPITTTSSPDGNLGTYSPEFINIGVAYAKTFSNSIHAGIAVHGISETIQNVTAEGVSVDFGVQYITGPKDNIKFGVSLRNIGTPMKYQGDGLVERVYPAGSTSYTVNFLVRSEVNELPSQLNIGASYDFLLGGADYKKVYKHRITIGGNFCSNSFTPDQLGIGAEYSLRDLFQVRGGYNIETPVISGDPRLGVLTGVTAGFSVMIPLKSKSSEILALDYAYRATTVFNGCNSFGLRLYL